MLTVHICVRTGQQGLTVGACAGADSEGYVIKYSRQMSVSINSYLASAVLILVSHKGSCPAPARDSLADY